MRKMVLLLVMVSVLLTGCCLQHDWTDATCKDPKTCSKCDETEGEALGHDWVDADCEEPKRCTRCDITKGSALGHDCTEWKAASKTTMSAACTVCGKEVEEAIDHELLAMQGILGKWRMTAYQPGGTDGTWELEYDPSIWVEFYDNDKMQYQVGDSGEGTYEYMEYNEEYDHYWYYCDFGDGYCRFRLDNDGELYWVTDNLWICFER